MHSVGSKLYPDARGAFWTRSPVFVLTWPLLVGLVVLLLAAGGIALMHHLRPSRRPPTPLHRVGGLVP